jgi:Fe-S cluster biogenesis protein NfuA
MLIETSLTADKNTINFFPPQELIKGDTSEFVDAKSMRKSPLAEKIFDIGGIKSILLTGEFISITKDDSFDWEELKPQILAEIMDFIATGENIVIEKNTAPSQDNIISQILSLIEARIRPALKQDGGDIVFKNFENGIVYVELIGNCAGCPYAMITLKDGVERILKTYIKEVTAVQSI